MLYIYREIHIDINIATCVYIYIYICIIRVCIDSTAFTLRF